MSFWTNKVALVTGASGNLGRAIAEAFVIAKAKVVLAARGVDTLETAAAGLRQMGGDVLPVAADITQQADVDRLIQQAIDRFGRLDVLVNNAGRSARGEILATTAEDFEDLMRLNLFALVRTTRAAAPHLLKSQGHVVNIGSLAAKSAGRYLGAYPATKFAVAAYSQQLRLELEPQGLHVLLVCPGPIAREQPRDYTDSRNVALPTSAHQPGGGVKVSRLEPEALAAAILRACERRQAELIMPAKARLLFTLSQLSPRLGDWLVRKVT